MREYQLMCVACGGWFGTTVEKCRDIPCYCPHCRETGHRTDHETPNRVSPTGDSGTAPALARTARHVLVTCTGMSLRPVPVGDDVWEARFVAVRTEQPPAMCPPSNGMALFCDRSEYFTPGRRYRLTLEET